MSSYTCILQGMNDSQNQQKLMLYMRGIFEGPTAGASSLEEVDEAPSTSTSTSAISIFDVGIGASSFDIPLLPCPSILFPIVLPL